MMQKTFENDWYTGIWVLFWENAARGFQWKPTWQGLDNFEKSLHHFALNERSLIIGWLMGWWCCHSTALSLFSHRVVCCRYFTHTIIYCHSFSAQFQKGFQNIFSPYLSSFAGLLCPHSSHIKETAGAAFVQSTSTQIFLKPIHTLSSWYSIDSSGGVLSDEYP